MRDKVVWSVASFLLFFGLFVGLFLIVELLTG